MITVNYDFRVREADLSNILKLPVHVGYNIFNITPVLEFQKILNEIVLFAVRQYVNFLLVFCISEDGLVFFTTSVALKFVYREDLRKRSTGIIYKPEIPECCLSGDIIVFSYIFCRMEASEITYHLSDQTVRNSVVTGKKAVLFAETLSASLTGISPFSDMKICANAVSIEVFDLLYSVIVDAVSR